MVVCYAYIVGAIYYYIVERSISKLLTQRRLLSHDLSKIENKKMEVQ